MAKLPTQPGFLPPGQSDKAGDPFTAARMRLKQAERLRLAGQIDKALAICEHLVRQHPRYMGALHTAGLLYSDKGEHYRALGFLVRAAMGNPRDWRVLTALSNVYLRLGAPEMAAQTLETARRMQPRDAGVLATLGEVYYTQREYEAAAEAFRTARTLDGKLWEAAMRLGQSCVHLGRYDEARDALEAAVQHKPAFLHALLWLAGLPSHLIRPEYLSRIDKAAKGQRRSKPSADAADAESTLLFARAGVLDKIGRHGEAWDDLVAANRLMSGPRQAECAEALASHERLLDHTRSRTLVVRGGSPGSGRDAISLFILGPSRSGKTTLEKLVGSLDGVKRGYENPIVEKAMLHALQSDGFLPSETFDLLPRECEASCRQLYLDDLEARAGSARVFTNTHPGRIIDAAQIAAVIPNARFIFVKRRLDDLALRIFMKKYAEGFAFAYDVGSIVRYVAWYNAMIDTLADRLAEISLVIRYEDMVADAAATLRSAARLCGLPMQDDVPAIGDDRGCAVPYLEFLDAETRRLLAG